MAPEILLGSLSSTPKIDVWSIGVLLYAMVLGEFPFVSREREELRQQILKKEIQIAGLQGKMLTPTCRVPAQVSQECLLLIEQLLKKDPEERLSIFDIKHHPWLSRYRRRMKRSFFGDTSEEEEETKETNSAVILPEETSVNEIVPADDLINVEVAATPSPNKPVRTLKRGQVDKIK